MYIGDGQQLLNNTEDHPTHNVHAEKNSSYGNGTVSTPDSTPIELSTLGRNFDVGYRLDFVADLISSSLMMRLKSLMRIHNYPVWQRFFFLAFHPKYVKGSDSFCALLRQASGNEKRSVSDDQIEEKRKRSWYFFLHKCLYMFCCIPLRP
ncbi:hypothetical protein OUZ56_004720 [Daphnia magna]|uniref:Uncharacterized protein n=1 Tax=Daphnia magna TaxID=35525 RepID=A0ABQ9YQN0_9CRUS|nr:hypothetical protein OUZ56_004720 [Daphnia magna]